MRSSVRCEKGRTDLETPLIECLKEPCLLVLVTDGCANVGIALDSHSLLSVARAMPAYAACTINTLGIQQARDVTLNAELLKQLAHGTNGAFRIAPDAESLAGFVGDALCSYYFPRYDRVEIKATSANGLVGSLVTPPEAGYVVRADRPTLAVLRWPAGAMGPFTVVVQGMPVGAQLGLQSALVCTSAEADAADVSAILGVVIAAKIDEKRAEPAFAASVKSLALSDFPRLMPLALALEELAREPAAGAGETPASTRAAQVVYEASQGYADSDPSPAVACARTASLAMAQAQML